MSRSGTGEGLGKTIGLRLPHEVEQQLEAEAAQTGIPVSTHIRTILTRMHGAGGLNGLAETSRKGTRASGHAEGYAAGWEEGLRRAMAQAKKLITEALKGQWPR